MNTIVTYLINAIPSGRRTYTIALIAIIAGIAAVVYGLYTNDLDTASKGGGLATVAGAQFFQRVSNADQSIEIARLVSMIESLGGADNMPQDNEVDEHAVH